MPTEGLPDDERRAAPGALAVTWFGLRTGLLAFGGGFAVIARVSREIVEDRRWLSREELAARVAVASALPGTSATNLVVMLGYRLAGTRGALGACAGYLAPSAAMMVGLGVFYDSLRGASAVARAFDGLGLAVVGLVAALALELARETFKRRLDVPLAIAAGVVLAGGWLGLLPVVLLAGAAGIARDRLLPPKTPRSPLWVLPLAAGGAWVWPKAAVIFGVFARVGVATFGGGFAMIPQLAREAEQRGWVDAQAFADAIAFGQLTPGPLAIASTFLGYRAGGLLGALAATLGMFGPTSILAAVAERFLPAVQKSATVRAAFAGIQPAVVGIIGAAAVHLWVVGTTTTGRGPFAIAIVAFAFAVRVLWPRSSPLAPLLVGGAATLVASWVRA